MNFSRLYGAVIANFITVSWNARGTPCFTAFQPYTEKSRGAPTPGFFKTSSPHQLMG